MKIVVLDGFTLNPGDLSWGSLQSCGDCSFYDRTTPQDILQRATNADVLITNKTILDAAMINALPSVRYIGIIATGTNVVDLDAATKRGIVVTNVPAYGVTSIAQATLALLLELTNHVGHYNQSVHNGAWSASPDFCYWDRQIVALSGLTMGILGFGSIGREVGALAQAFGMKLLVHTRTPVQQRPDIEFCDRDTLFQRSDVVSLHCVLNADTRDVVNAARLAMMKPSAYFLNVARGPLVVEQDLADALNTGKLAGAALDVLATEPPQTDNILFSAKNCIITPHVAWASLAARKKLLDIAVENVHGFINGQPQNVVNP